MANRRTFIQQIGLVAGAFSANSLFNQAHAAEFSAASQRIQLLSPLDAAADEDYWSIIQQSFTVSPNIINLNNGGVSPSPRVVQEAVARYNNLTNEGPSYFMWRILDQGREPLREKLATLAGCDKEEVAINRNATEALNTVIYGLSLKAGDEVIGTKQDYPNMINAWKQRATREGIVYKQISFMFPIENDEVIVEAYEK
ncbi:MAG: aminotransferase class V-fold PLP-dependent enzyme, partial [Ferruginibacter sp.]